MSANKKPVNTPLHLLQQLSGSLLEHLENACSQALADAEKLLAKLESSAVKRRKNCTSHVQNCKTPPTPENPRLRPRPSLGSKSSSNCSTHSKTVKAKRALIFCNSNVMLKKA